MDIKLEPKKWYIRYRGYITGGILFLILIAYVIISALSPKTLHVDKSKVQVADVVKDEFIEYVNVDGVLTPVSIIKVNAREAGTVQRIVAEAGSMLQAGDTILVLSNPELERAIEDQRDSWQQQYNGYLERIIEMEQQSLALQQKNLQAKFELQRLEKQIKIDRDEYAMGIKSKAELEVAEEEYAYRKEEMKLQMNSLAHDSTANNIRRKMLEASLASEKKRLQRCIERRKDLVIFAPVAGQLGSIDVTQGKHISAGSEISEVMVLDHYKLLAKVNEYYVDKLTKGQPATTIYKDREYAMIISKIVPEVREGEFPIEMLFTDSLPDNARIGKSYQAKIELSSARVSVMVPKGNFYPYTAGKWIFKMNGDGTRAVRVPITIERQNPLFYEISSGVEPGDKVIITGYEDFENVEEIIIK